MSEKSRKTKCQSGAFKRSKLKKAATNTANISSFFTTGDDGDN